MKKAGPLILAMLIATLGMAGTASAQCIDNLADGLGPAYDVVEIGETIEYTISLSVPASPAPPSPPNCTLVNVDVYFFPPPLGSPEGHPCDADPGLGILIDSGLTLVPGAAPFVYTSADNAILSYVAQSGDAGGTVYAHMATYFNTEDNPTGPQLCDEKESAVDVGCPEPCVEITKTVDCEWSKVGDWVTYTICVENCGELFDLTNVVVTDDLLGGSLGFPGTLAPGEHVCLDFLYEIQPGDDTGLPGATVVNTASVSAEQFCGDEITPVGDDSDPVVVTLLHPDFDVTKECMSPQVPAGGSAEFLVTITNLGDVDLEISTDDAAIPPFTLTTGDPIFTQTVYVPDPGGVDEICNTINVEARIPAAYCELPNVLTDSASDCCPVVEPCIDVTKEVDCDISKEGDEVVYTICVTNCGDVDLYNVVVSDPMLGGVLPEFASFLAVGASECHDYTYMIPGGANDPVENTVSADGQSEFGVSAPTAYATETVDLIHPDFEVTKECMSPTVPAGGSAEFLVTITNLGDVDLEISTDDAAIPPFTLTTGDPIFTQSVYVTDPGGVDEICNTINVEARIPDELCNLPNVLTDSASDCCPVEGPCIDVTKEVDCDISKEGDEVVYTICVTNCGEIDLYSVVVNDPMLGGVLPEFASFLAVGASECHDYTYMIPGGASDPVENTVSADGQSEFGVSAPTAYATETVDLIHPDFEVTKECMSPTVPAGGTAEFLVTITNLGDVNLEISTDDAAIPPFTLTMGDPIFTQTVYVTDPGGVDEICNTINVEARIPAAYCELPNVLTGSASDCCPVVEPCIDVTKEVDCDISKEGDEVIYTICVTNCGDVDLYSVVVNDPMLGGVLPEFASFLAVGASECHDYTYVIPGGASDPVENTVSADGETEFGFPAPTAYATETVDLIHPDFTVTKVCLTPEVPAGGNAEFEITINNTGDCDLDFTTNEPEITPFTLTPTDPALALIVTRPCEGPGPLCNEIIVTATIPPEYCELPNVIVKSADDCCECAGGDHGCTPGFWKNHPDCWCAEYDPDDLVGDVFDVPAELAELADDSLMNALKYGGGNGVIGAARNLLRHGVSALLNACNGDVPFPMGVAGVISTVNTALATLDRDEITAAKNVLAAYNELGCSIDAHCRPIDDYDDLRPQREPKEVGDAAGELMQGKEAGELLPTQAAVSQSSPNPFRDSARIQFQIPTSGTVAIDVYDVSGRHVVSLMDEEKPAGYHEVAWDGRNTAGARVPAGVYFYRVSLEDETLMKKMIMMK